MHIKDFDLWNKIKKEINEHQDKPFIRKREIRWAVLGVNVGSEIDGKDKSFTRPVVIIDTIGKTTALVVPITSKHKEIPGRFEFKWKDNINSICVNQMKVISTKRILDRKGKISENKLKDIKEKIKDFYRLDL
ncbi:type II toxin-antitoxin system PemK/MazF family toxin [Candidatus Nomurabacteria bacterium]|nr:type II toxin-antitoxin system PemK/MazF family toxin [Candidatus Nomurabacteria bacterium]